MSLPDAIQRQVDAVAEFEQQAAAQPPAPPAPPANDEPALVQPPAPPAEPHEDDPSWMHKYKTLQGKYNREMPELQQQVGEQSRQIEMLMGQLRELTNVPRPTDDFSSAGTEVQIADEERNEYGDELLDLIGRRALQVLLPEVRRIEAMIDEVRRGVVGVHHDVQVSVHDRFLQELDKRHPSWRTINNDENFMRWLADVEPMSGRPRQELLGAAVNDHNVERALVFFRGFEAEKGVQPQPSPQPGAQPPETGLEAFAAPGRGRPGPAPSPANDLPKVWARSQITAFYRDVNMGLYRGREAEAQQIEQSIMRAAATNQVTPN